MGSYLFYFIVFHHMKVFLVKVIVREYQFINKLGGKGSEDGQLVTPHSIDIDKDGNGM
jgi:hypothetical protein